MDISTPRVMGILNITPDSFYDGGRYARDKDVLQHAENMFNEGAAIIDVGGYSSRPNASDISIEEEKNRVLPAIRSIVRHFPESILSIDTFRSEVARSAVGEGALLINDISGGDLDSGMFSTVAQLKVPYICMHMKGTPQTMTDFSAYDNLMHELIAYFHSKVDQLHSLGVADIILDPGFGFAKNVEQNFQLLRSLERLRIFRKPVLVGLSRKSMIWKTLNSTAEEALNGTTALNTIALLKGASILRVHDVRPAVEIVKLFHALNLR
jgi:dihydropteroate synthase